MESPENPPILTCSGELSGPSVFVNRPSASALDLSNIACGLYTCLYRVKRLSGMRIGQNRPKKSWILQLFQTLSSENVDNPWTAAPPNCASSESVVFSCLAPHGITNRCSCDSGSKNRRGPITFGRSYFDLPNACPLECVGLRNAAHGLLGRLRLAMRTVQRIVLSAPRHSQGYGASSG